MHDHLWIVTDASGRIEVLSPAAAALIGVRNHSSGGRLLTFFPQDRRAMAVDIESALAGWPIARTVTLAPTASRRAALVARSHRHACGSQLIR